MKAFFYLIPCLVLFLPGARASDISPEKMALIDRYLDLTHAAAGFEAGLRAGLDAGFNPEANPGLAVFGKEKLARVREELGILFRDHFSFEALRENLVPMIDEAYTVEELAGLNEILTNPLMQKMILTDISQMPELTRLSTEAVIDLQAEIQAVVQRVLMEE